MEIKNTIGLYLDPKTKEAIEKITNFIFLEPYIDLSKPKILNKLISKKYLKHATNILKKIYQVAPRGIATNNYGMAFTTEPEILKFLMELCENKKVLEIAGASGEHSQILALSGAKKVFMNDIDSLEFSQFENNNLSLPKEIQNKIEGLHGDIFETIKTIKSKVDIILCRNFIHFLDDNKQSRFFSSLKEKLIKGGKVIFITNSIYSVPNVYEIAKKNLKCSSFKVSQLLVTDLQKSSMPCMNLLQICTFCDSKLIKTDYTNHYLLKRSIGEQWKTKKNAFKKLETNVTDKILEKIKQSSASIKEIKKGTIRLLITYLRFYSEKSLALLFEKNGFLTEHTFVVKKNGHLLRDNESPKKFGQQVGIIATLK